MKQLLVQASQDDKRHDEKRAQLLEQTSGIVSSTLDMFQFYCNIFAITCAGFDDHKGFSTAKV